MRSFDLPSHATTPPLPHDPTHCAEASKPVALLRRNLREARERSLGAPGDTHTEVFYGVAKDDEPEAAANEMEAAW